MHNCAFLCFVKDKLTVRHLGVYAFSKIVNCTQWSKIILIIPSCWWKLGLTSFVPFQMVNNSTYTTIVLIVWVLVWETWNLIQVEYTIPSIVAESDCVVLSLYQLCVLKEKYWGVAYCCCTIVLPLAWNCSILYK